MSFGSYGSSSAVVTAPTPAPVEVFNVLTLTDSTSPARYSDSKAFIENVAKDSSNSSIGDRPLAARIYVRFSNRAAYRSQASIYNLIRRARNRFAK